MHAPTSHTAPRRVVVFVLLAAFGCLQVASLFHAATERHAVCPEHGELVHVSTDSGVLALAGAGDTSPETRAHAGTPTDQGAHDHDHCYLCPSSRVQASLPSAETLAAAAPEAHATHGIVATDTPIAAQRYLVAPKQSPPA